MRLLLSWIFHSILEKTRLTHWLSPTNVLTAHNKQLQAQEISNTMLHPFNSKSCKLWDLNFPLAPTCIGSVLSRYPLYNCTCTFETLKIRFRNMKYFIPACQVVIQEGRELEYGATKRQLANFVCVLEGLGAFSELFPKTFQSRKSDIK